MEAEKVADIMQRWQQKRAARVEQMALQAKEEQMAKQLNEEKRQANKKKQKEEQMAKQKMQEEKHAIEEQQKQQNKPLSQDEKKGIEDIVARMDEEQRVKKFWELQCRAWYAKMQ
jgi:hypothetical protein